MSFAAVRITRVLTLCQVSGCRVQEGCHLPAVVQPAAGERQVEVVTAEPVGAPPGLAVVSHAGHAAAGELEQQTHGYNSQTPR